MYIIYTHIYGIIWNVYAIYREAEKSASLQYDACVKERAKRERYRIHAI